MINRQLSLSGAVDSYLQDLQNSNYSPNTLRVYKTDLRALEAFFNNSLNELTANILVHFLHSSMIFARQREPANKHQLLVF